LSNALQNRLVGTVILVAVTVIFLPDYLDGEKQKNTETFIDFPRTSSDLSAQAPEIFPSEEIAAATRKEVVILDEQALDAVLESGNTTIDESATKTDNESLSQSDPADKSALSAQDDINRKKQAAVQQAQDGSLAQQTVAKSTASKAQENAGWVVQLGSFGNQKNVNDLLRKLEKAGYRSFSRKVQTSAGRLTKVFVGPELDKEKLDLALPHLKETTGLTGKVTTFDVVAD
jgi:DedD protein